MRNECLGCGAILPEHMKRCPICGGEELKKSEPVPEPAPPVRPEGGSPSGGAGSPDEHGEKDHQEQVSTAPQDDLEAFFMETLSREVLGEPETETPTGGTSSADVEAQPSAPTPRVEFLIHEILILSDEDNLELVRKRYGAEGFTGTEVMRVRDMLSSEGYSPGRLICVDADRGIYLLGGDRLRFAVKMSGTPPAQAEFVIRKVAEVGEARLPANIDERDIKRLQPIMEKLCDAMNSALMKLVG